MSSHILLWEEEGEKKLKTYSGPKMPSGNLNKTLFLTFICLKQPNIWLHDCYLTCQGQPPLLAPGIQLSQTHYPDTENRGTPSRLLMSSCGSRQGQPTPPVPGVLTNGKWRHPVIIRKNSRRRDLSPRDKREKFGSNEADLEL